MRRRRLRDLAGFVGCLFDAHRWRYHLQRDWLECDRRWCPERRLTEPEIRALEASGAIRPRRG